MTFMPSDLHLIICEDEYMLAMSLAEQFSAMGANVVELVTSVADIEQVVMKDSRINAAVLDIELLDGEVYGVLPLLEQRGLALTFCSAYPPHERPDRFAHLDWFDKLAPAEQIAAALCAAHDVRSADHIR